MGIGSWTPPSVIRDVPDRGKFILRQAAGLGGLSFFCPSPHLEMQVGGQNGVRILLLANKLVFMSERACLEFASYLPLAEFRGTIEFDDEGLESTDDEGLELTVFNCMCKTSIID